MAAHADGRCPHPIDHRGAQLCRRRRVRLFRRPAASDAQSPGQRGRPAVRRRLGQLLVGRLVGAARPRRRNLRHPRFPFLPADDRRLAARRLSLQLSAGDAAHDRAVRAHPLCAGAFRLAHRELVRLLPRAQAGAAGARRIALGARFARGADQCGGRTERLLDGGAARRWAEPHRAAALSRRLPVRPHDLQAATCIAAAGRAHRRTAVEGDRSRYGNGGRAARA